MTLKGLKNYAFWIKLYGLIWLLLAFSILFFESESILFGLLYLAIYIVIGAISLFLREVVYGFRQYRHISVYLQPVFDIFEEPTLFR